jgi:putative spermidine/putrescine transport system ATP-binding protein/spermidine/putrescine transport system ATP-binding protein
MSDRVTDTSSAVDVRFARVTKRFSDTVAVKELTLDIPRGSFFSLLGPSGCGKTTTLRLIAGFELPDEGDVFIRQTRVNEIPPYRRDFAMVFQNFALFPHLTVTDNVAFGLRMSGVARAERAAAVADALALVKLGGLADRFPKQLSGGQQQRVAIARAIVMKPAVLLLDEPLGALDKNLREAMQVELRALQRQLDLTMVFVTHDQEEALTMSDGIAVMRNGVIEQLGAPREIYENPATEFIATFLGASNLIEATVTATDTGAGTSLVTAGCGSMVVNGTHPVGARLKLAIRPERLLLTPAAEAAPGMIEAVVRDVVYRGMTAQVYLEGRGQPLLAFVQNTTSSALDWPPGSRVGVGMPAESLVLLRDQP